MLAELRGLLVYIGPGTVGVILGCTLGYRHVRRQRRSERTGPSKPEE